MIVARVAYMSRIMHKQKANSVHGRAGGASGAACSLHDAGQCLASPHQFVGSELPDLPPKSPTG